MVAYYMGGKYGQGYTGATHMTKVYVKRTILFLQCISCLSQSEHAQIGIDY